ncbi:hypothetical protein [Exiguobacterium sp. s133]|uniref:hypothetical protein n=1 Tax=Exiguobacterium sp. s133 TaxID=2751213 RepID=UPI001BE8F185|nr:hypothetical protein [Exiguobacterium sp. s133]
MNKDVNNRHSLTITSLLTKTSTSIVTLTLLLSLTLMLPNQANAASKEYESYKRIKLGMTVTDVAKSIYGKSYKSHLKEENNVKTLNSKFLVKDIQKDYKYYHFVYYPKKKSKGNLFEYRMSIIMKTKQKGNTLYVVEKSYEPTKPSSKSFYKGKKPKEGTTLTTVDKSVSGKGLGVFVSHYTRDYSKVGEVVGKNKVEYSKKETWIYYNTQSSTGKTKYSLPFKYDYKKKVYILN